MCTLITSQLVRVPLRNFSGVQTTCRDGMVIMRVPFLELPPPNIWDGRLKKRPDVGAISDNFRLWSRTSPNGSTYRTCEKRLINHNPFHVGGMKFDELWSTNKNVVEMHTDPSKWIFLEDCISGLMGCCPLKFLQALEIDQALLAHTRTVTGVPPPQKKN